MKFIHLPENADVMVQVCPRINDPVNIAIAKPWRKSPSASMVYILVIGAGGDGGPSSGGGGGSGGQTSVLIPAALLPDTLFVSEYANTDADFVAVYTVAENAASTLFRAGCVARANNGGDFSNPNLGGSGGTVAVAADMPRGWGGIVVALAGQAGGGGSTVGAASALSYPTTGLLVTGGAGGGATSGGSISASAPRPLIAGGATGVSGSHGINLVNGAFLPSGGAGGGGGGGAGGNGGIGCGGGGGGSSGGLGGAGGPGLIVIAQW